MIDHAGRSGELLVNEAVHIQLTSRDEGFNKDEGMELPKCWMASIGKRSKGWFTVRHKGKHCLVNCCRKFVLFTSTLVNLRLY